MKLLLPLTLAFALAACTTPQVPPATQTPAPQTNVPKILGLLEVRISGDNLGTARFIDASSFHPQGSLRASGGNTITVVPDAGIEFTRRAVNFSDSDDTTPTTRRSQAIFDVINKSPRVFNNLTLYAMNIPGRGIGGTSITGMAAGNGTPITDETIARSFKPMHGMRTIAGGVQVQPSLADLQLVKPTEAANVQAQAAALSPAINGSVLEYGFVARNSDASKGRTIEAGDGTGCAVNKGVPSACTGTITFAYVFPVAPITDTLSRSQRPWAFSLYFVVADQSISSYSQSLEEQSAGTVTGQDPTGLFGLRALFSSSPPSAAEILCRVQTAISTTTNPSSEYLGVVPGTVGCP